MRVVEALVIAALCLTLHAAATDETTQSLLTSTPSQPIQPTAAPPEGLLLLDLNPINSTTVQLSWNNTSNEILCPVRRFVVRVRDDSSIRARSWRYDRSTNSAVISGLRPATEYQFRLVVDTECSNGKGKAGKWVSVNTPPSSLPPASGERVAKSLNTKRDKQASNGGLESTTTSQALPGQPLLVRTRVVTPDSVLVTWQAPLDGGQIGGYMIGYGEGVPDVNWQYLEAHRRNVTIKNLKPSTQYVISVRAFNDIDKGPVVYDLVYTTTSSYNSVTSSEHHPAPVKLHSRMLSSSSVWVQWVDPSLGKSQRLTDSRYYNVHYQATPNGKTLSVIVKELHAVLNDLEPGTRYEFKVRTVKDGQTSPFSEIVVNWTLNITTSTVDYRSSTKPTRSASERNSNAWRSVLSDEESNGDNQNGGDDDDDDDDEWLKVDKSFVRDGQQYLQSDSSKKKREPGSMLYPRQDKKSKLTTTIVKIQPEVKFSTLVLHRISAYITWPSAPPSDQCTAVAVNNHVTGYKIRYQLTDDVNEFVSQNLSENFVLLENLLSGVKYRYHVKYLMENGGETAWSAEGIINTMPSHR